MIAACSLILVTEDFISRKRWSHFIYLFIFQTNLSARIYKSEKLALVTSLAKVHIYHLAIFNDSLTKDNNVWVNTKSSTFQQCPLKFSLQDLRRVSVYLLQTQDSCSSSICIIVITNIKQFGPTRVTRTNGIWWQEYARLSERYGVLQMSKVWPTAC